MREFRLGNSPVQDDLPRLAAAHDVEPFLEVVDPEPVRDHWSDIQAALDHGGLATKWVAEHAPRAQRGPTRSESSNPEAQAVGLVRLKAAYDTPQSRITFPDWPLRMTSNPFWKSSIPKRCVITGVMSRPLWIMAAILYQVSNISRP